MKLPQNLDLTHQNPNQDWFGKVQSLLESSRVYWNSQPQKEFTGIPNPKKNEQCVPPQKGWDFDYYSEESSHPKQILGWGRHGRRWNVMVSNKFIYSLFVLYLLSQHSLINISNDVGHVHFGSCNSLAFLSFRICVNVLEYSFNEVSFGEILA